MENKNTNTTQISISWKMILIVAGILLAIVACVFAIGIHAENRCYHMEEQIKESKSGIDIQLKKRNDSIKELVHLLPTIINVGGGHLPRRKNALLPLEKLLRTV